MTGFVVQGHKCSLKKGKVLQTQIIHICFVQIL